MEINRPIRPGDVVQIYNDEKFTVSHISEKGRVIDENGTAQFTEKGAEKARNKGAVSVIGQDFSACSEETLVNELHLALRMLNKKSELIQDTVDIPPDTEIGRGSAWDYILEEVGKGFETLTTAYDRAERIFDELQER